MDTRIFDAQALYDAIDAQRRDREMTWAALSKELNVSVTTIKGMTKRRWGLELDGVMGMCQWVGKTVEDFAGRDGGPPIESIRTKSGRFLRFDTIALYNATDAERQRRALTWDQVAKEVWPEGPWGTNQLKGLARGGRGEVHNVLAICGWLGSTIQSFTKEAWY